jgi:DMSO reductase anchor subunit
MNPALSIIFFTTLAGAGQGLAVALAVAALAGVPLSDGFLPLAIVIAGVLLLLGLGASFLHLGRPERAWRAVLMWRTSWMSREVIALPAFIAVVGLWWLALVRGVDGVALQLLPFAVIVLAAVLWYCTAMIYACLRFVQEWAHALTVVNYTLIGLSSGLVLAAALAALGGEEALLRSAGPSALVATLAAWATRALSLRRNARLKPKSTLQSATGINAARVVQKSMGMSGGAYNTREFFHHATLAALKRVKLGFIVFGFALPSALLAWALAGGPAVAWLVAAPLQYVGLLGERWFFFAQARHPQNLYYQVVS